MPGRWSASIPENKFLGWGNGDLFFPKVCDAWIGKFVSNLFNSLVSKHRSDKDRIIISSQSDSILVFCFPLDNWENIPNDCLLTVFRSIWNWGREILVRRGGVNNYYLLLFISGVLLIRSFFFQNENVITIMEVVSDRKHIPQ